MRPGDTCATSSSWPVCLLYGVDVGVIAAALPYIEQTAGFNPSQLSQVVAAVLFGSVLSSLFAGYLADKLGRKALITVAAALFTVSIPVICLSQEVFGIMLLGRILQGASAGIVGVVVPLYLAECLSAESRGKGTGMFQFLLTVGLVFAAVVGLLAASYVGGVEKSRRERGNADFRQDFLRGRPFSGFAPFPAFSCFSVPSV